MKYQAGKGENEKGRLMPKKRHFVVPPLSPLHFLAISGRSDHHGRLFPFPPISEIPISRSEIGR